MFMSVYNEKSRNKTPFFVRLRIWFLAHSRAVTTLRHEKATPRSLARSEKLNANVGL